MMTYFERDSLKSDASIYGTIQTYTTKTATNLIVIVTVASSKKLDFLTSPKQVRLHQPNHSYTLVRPFSVSSSELPKGQK